MTPDKKDKGLRYNEGKLRYDLIPPYAEEQYAKVLTAGSIKYKPRNWEAGMPFTTVIASLERHLQAIKRGEDYDPETGLLHSAHIMCNSAFLTEYYKIYPQGDDRPHGYLNRPKIGLDIDDVIADWCSHWSKYHKHDLPEFWNFDKDINKKFELLKDDKKFWLSVPPKIIASTLPFEPWCYITSRNIPKEWTEEWLQVNGFPSVPVYSIGHGESKVEVAKSTGIDIFVDDRFDNFVDLNRNGVCCFLMDAKHNQRYDVGFKRIYSLKDLVK